MIYFACSQNVLLAAFWTEQHHSSAIELPCASETSTMEKARVGPWSPADELPQQHEWTVLNSNQERCVRDNEDMYVRGPGSVEGRMKFERAETYDIDGAAYFLYRHIYSRYDSFLVREIPFHKAPLQYEAIEENADTYIVKAYTMGGTKKFEQPYVATEHLCVLALTHDILHSLGNRASVNTVLKLILVGDSSGTVAKHSWRVIQGRRPILDDVSAKQRRITDFFFT